MGSSPCCSKVGLQKGPWSTKEDALLSDYILRHGEGRWRALPKNAGLLRCGKSCRLRWMNYLRPGIKRGNIDRDEEDLIVRMHGLLGNRWSLIAGRLPGRTDNEIKNYWNTHLLKKLRNATHKELPENSPEKKERKRVKKNGAAKPESNGEPGEAKVKVYMPKPIRVSTGFCGRNGCYDTPTNGVSSKVDWPSLLYGEIEGGFSGGGCVPPPQDSVSGEGDMLELVYDEYLQLL